MELGRILRILRARWWIVLVAAALGFVSAFGFTTLSNESLDPLYQASIPVRFDPDEGQTVEDLADQVEDEHGLALLAAESLLQEYPSASIFQDTTSARLVFTAQGSSSDEALERANALVEAYFETDPVVGGDIDQRLQGLESQAEEIQQRIEELRPSLSAEDQLLIARHDFLDRRIQAIQDQLVTLTVVDAGASEEVREENRAAREDLEESLGELQEQKANLPPRPSDSLQPADQLKLNGLDRAREILRLDYERLFLRTIGVSTTGRVEQAGLNDLTPEPASAVLNGILGLVGGFGIGTLSAVGISHIRKEVWLSGDLPIPVVAIVPHRKPTPAPGPSWYDSTESGARKEKIQAARTAIEGAFEHTPAVLTLVADRIDVSDHHALAVDLAASFASAGRKVLLVGADFSFSGDMAEYSVGEPTLDLILNVPSASTETLVKRIDGLLKDVVHIRPDLAVLPSGPSPATGADSLAGRQFRILLDQARTRFEVILVVGGSLQSAAANVLIQRSGNALLSVSPGNTTVPAIETFMQDLDNIRANPVGAIMVYGSDVQDGWIPDLTITTTAERQAPEPSDSPVTRLRFYPFPGTQHGSYSPSDGSLARLLESISIHSENLKITDAEEGQEPNWGGFGGEVMEALRSSQQEVAYAAVTNYLVARTEDVLTAVAGESDVSPELVEVILDQGFIPLTRVKGLRSVGEWLTVELRYELGDKSGDELSQVFADVLKIETGDYPTAIDAFLAQEFFRHHLERTQGEPEVWHLTSDMGTAQVLAYGRRLTREKLVRLSAGVVRRSIDELQRLLRDADEEETIVRLEERLKELHRFEVSLGLLQVGGSDEARIRYPWRRSDQQPSGWMPVWTEGIRPNIAPLQRLGILAYPVLTEEELISGDLVG